jgi:hypothetical protein
MASGDRNDKNPKTDPDRAEPAGISNAAVEGARSRGAAPAGQGRDARTVDSEFASEVTGNSAAARRTENAEVPLGGGEVAFPAPSAQPSQVDRPDDDATTRRAAVNVAQDEDLEWRRAGGGSPDAGEATGTAPPQQAPATRGPSVGAVDVALGKPSSGDATGDTAPREDGGQAGNPPKSLGSAGGGSSGPGSANHNE